MQDLPEDLVRLALRYAKPCESCLVRLNVGDRAYWSPSERSVWCPECVGEARRSGRKASRGRPAREQARQRGSEREAAAWPPQPAAGDQAQWEQLCAYAFRCVEAEAAGSLTPHRDAGRVWFGHFGAERLIVGAGDSIPAPDELNDRLESLARERDEPAAIYGWPTVVLTERNRDRKVAPLFYVHVDLERHAGGKWILNAADEPQFNPGITAGRIFDPAITEGVGDLLDDGLPFGDAQGLAELAGELAGVLGLRVLSAIDAEALDPAVSRDQGVHNAAVSVLTDALSDYNSGLCKELEALQGKKDWATSAAAHLIAPHVPRRAAQRQPHGTLAIPLEANQSQQEALDSLRREPLSVVTGPPGTGKTQLVVNAVSNAWLDGETVLVASTNNKAVEVAVDRANKVCGGLLLRTGNREQREKVSGRVREALAEAESQAGDAAAARRQLERDAGACARLTERLERLDELDARLLSTVELLEKASAAREELEHSLWPWGGPPELPVGSQRIELRARRLLRTWIFPRLRERRLRQLLRCVESEPLERIVDWAETDRRASRLSARLDGAQARRAALANALGDPHDAIRKAHGQCEEASHVAVRAEAHRLVRAGSRRLGAFGRVPAGGVRFRKVVAASKRYLRGWACTALSAHSSFPLDAGLFELVIIDEASQCSLAAVLPLAYRAKRLAVVGDPYQLQPIVSLGDRLLENIAVQSGCDNDDLRRRGLHHKEGSAYAAFEQALEPTEPVLLNEHYRCHPRIAGWFNKCFYDGRLVVLADTTDGRGSDRRIAWLDVSGQAERPGGGRSWLNRAEAEKAVEVVRRAIEVGIRSIGVVTPFAAQAQLIERRAEERIGRIALRTVGFTCGTAHGLQGDAREAVIISAVLAPGIAGNGARWIERERNLLNVAVSRARQSLLVLGHPGVGSLGCETLESLRDWLKGNAGGSALVAGDRTDSASERVLLKAMQFQGIPPDAKVNVGGYELDFALREEGLKLDIEVDGDQHLDVRRRQRRQDIARDRVLGKLGWSVLRIPAWRCHRDIDAVIHDILRMRHRARPEPVGGGD